MITNYREINLIKKLRMIIRTCTMRVEGHHEDDGDHGPEEERKDMIILPEGWSPFDDE